ncbi:MAG: class I SAM-dependent methyltransferase [Actinomycetota bacterium]|nr:class I SAM-dependent methyltransferase [Actinomycetota bacterium]
MEGYDPSTYGDRIADVYDDMYEDLFDRDEVVDVLAELAGGGRALELAIGTGRIALPLAATGVEVHGIDASQAMVAKLRSKPGGEAIPVTIGDFAEVAVDGTFALVYLVFNTLFALETQEEQVECFANVARALDPGGCFVVEAFFPDVARFDRGQRVDATRVQVDRVSLDVSRHDPVAQTVLTQHVVIGQERTSLYPVFLRYVWPPEMDLMARLAGLRLRSRWGGWKREPFTAPAQKVVSVYELPEKD